MLRPIVVLVIVLLVCIMLIPVLIVQWLPQSAEQVQEEVVELKPPEVEKPLVYVSVYRTEKDEIENIPLEAYIRGVVASEMPAEFELEALKAQALAARTYIIRRLVEKDFSDTPDGATVTDTIQHQVYRNEEELRVLWGMDYERRISKINQAVNETEGQVLTYNGKPINATFFSTSNGYTENSEDYWGASIAYLRSVESPWDVESPRYENERTISLKQLQNELGIQIAVPVSTNQSAVEVVSRTEGNRVKEIKIGDHTFTGKEVREKLDLDSAHFDLRISGDHVMIATKGYGHGVGMSQWGANGMAQEGSGAEEIVRYYYQNIEIQDYREWIVKK